MICFDSQKSVTAQSIMELYQRLTASTFYQISLYYFFYYHFSNICISCQFQIKLAQHSHSCIFGTFLCNTLKERIDNSVFDRTFSVWTFLSEPCYKNPLYVPHHERVLWPAHHVRDLVLWSEVYLHSLRNQKSDNPRANLDASDSLAESAAIHEDEAMQSPPPALLLAHSAQQQLQAHHPSMTKTRSYNDLLKADVSNGHLPRRSSDPNMVPDLQ